MRDALLRRNEAATLTWGDIERVEDGSGRLQLHRSKTDQEGVGVVLYLALATMQALEAIRQGAPDSASVFGLSASQIPRRIKSGAEAAGLKGRFSGHSYRVGIAWDLAATGCELPALMQAGRGAVARYYSQKG